MNTIKRLMLGLALIAGFSVSGLYAGGKGGGGGNGNAGSEVTGELVPPAGTVTLGETPTIGWLINRPKGHSNNGHGNNVDGVDSSNPGKGGGGPNGPVDPSGGVDDEIRGGGDAGSNAAIGDNEIRQMDNESGIQMFIYSDQDEGEEAAQFPISAAGSEFELWADIQGVLKYLDNMQVGGTPPTATFAVNTQDPWVGSQTVVINGQQVSQDIRRTRADFAFSTSATVGNLSSDPNAPLMARQLEVYHEGRNATLNEMNMTYPLEAPYVISTTVANNTTPYHWSGLTRLTGANPADKLGVEKVEVRTLGGTWTSPDGSQTATINPWTVGSASVIVWPVTKGYFTQMNDLGTAWEPFVNNQQVFVEIPNIYVNYRHMYPGSTTFVQIYKGDWEEGKVGMPIVTVTKVPSVNATEAEKEVLRNSVAQNTAVEGIVVRNVDLQEHVNYLGNGIYTMEILTGGMDWLNDFYGNGNGIYGDDPPYFEPVAHINFVINQNVKVRGQIGTK